MERRNFIKKLGVLVASSTVCGVEVLHALEPNTDAVLSTLGVDDDDVDAKLASPLTAIVIGAGQRGGKNTDYSALYPNSMQVVGVSDILDFRKERMAKKFLIEKANCFGDWSEVFEVPKFADIVIISTPDHLHYEPCMKALEMGYHVILEKPAATTLEHCVDIKNQAKKYGKIVALTHVLRYTPFYSAMKEAVSLGKIGDILNVQHMEGIGLRHFAHSYVRGNWHNSLESTPVILSKSCHDLDIISWLVEKPCRSVSAFGHLSYFSKKNMPSGAGKRCLSCSVERTCYYSAKRIYYDNRTSTYVFDLSGDKEKQGEQILNYLRNSNYGRCVFQMDNDQCDHYVMNMEFADKVTASFNMTTTPKGRFTCITGTKGSIVGDLHKNRFTVKNSITNETEEWEWHGGRLSGHSGGDVRLVRDFLLAVSKNDPSLLTSTIDVSMGSHIMGFYAEESRKECKTKNLK